MGSRHTKLQPHRLPSDLVEGYERRLATTTTPQDKLPEVSALRAIGLALCAHIAWLEQELKENATG